MMYVWSRDYATYAENQSTYQDPALLKNDELKRIFGEEGGGYWVLDNL